MNISKIIQESVRVGKGVERSCYVHKDYPGKVFKVSEEAESRQSQREIAYFKSLKRKKVPFTYLPEFYGSFRQDGKVVIIQQKIAVKGGNQKIGGVTFAEYIRDAPDAELLKKRYSELQNYIDELESYLTRFNILLTDVNPYNLVLISEGDKKKFYIVDGLGCTEFIPLSDFFPFLGRRKIKRYMARLRKKVEICFLETAASLDVRKEKVS